MQIWMIGAARARLRTPFVGKQGCAVSNDRCLAPDCRRIVIWIKDLVGRGVTIWSSV